MADLEILCSSREITGINHATVPIISIPTTLSGGEFSDFAGATDDRTGEKRMFTSSQTRGPDLVILDPALATTTPDRIWISTGVRAVDHCVEALCSLHGSKNHSDDISENALGQLIPGLLRSAKDTQRKDLEARLECQLGTADAMNAVRSRVMLGASHGIGHQLGPFGVGHGETSCILLPAVCKYNLRHADSLPEQEGKALRERQERLRKFLLASNPIVREVVRSRSHHDDVDKADLGDILDAVFRELGMPRSLKDVGVTLSPEQLDLLCVNSLRDLWCPTNPVPLLDKKQVLEILQDVLG